MRRRLFCFALAAFIYAILVACPKPAPVPPPLPDWMDGGIGDAAPATCADVCAHWRDLGCVEGADQDKCNGVCGLAVANSTYSELVHWNLECRVRITACSDIDRCEGALGASPGNAPCGDAAGAPDASRPPDGGKDAGHDAGLPGPPTCASVCAHLVLLRCAVAATPSGVPCAEVCAQENKRAFTAWNLPCRAKAGTCAAASACEH